MLLYAIDLSNASASACSTGGYVGVSAYSPAGLLITAADTRVTMFGSPETLLVASGATISFEIGAYDTNGAASCGVTFGALHLVPPNAVSSIQLATRGPHGFPPLCQDRIDVGALRYGND